MEITKKNRTELKSYFLTNKIPTQKNFEEFIDAGLNQTDDGIMKAQGRPLALQAEGDDSGTQEVLQLYKKLVDNNPRWSINMNPRTDPGNTATGKLGLNISDAAGVSRFFIKGDDGNVGLGTITPAQKLHVQVSNNGLNLPVYVRNANGTEGGNAVGIAFLNEAQGDWPKAAVVHERTAGFGVGSLRFLVNGSANNSAVTLADTRMTIHSNGNVGIGSTTPGVPLTFTDSLGDKISLWGQAGNTYGFGIQGSLLQIHTSGADGSIAFGYGSSGSLNESARITSGGNIFAKGSLGVGMTSISDLYAGSKMTGKGNLVLRGASPQIDFLDVDHSQWSIHVNTNKMYFIREPWIFTDLVLDGKGNIGMGTDNPQAKLQVVGGAIQPSVGNSENAGIMFPKDAFSGSGDSAYIRYYARPGATAESATLEIGIANDADDHIALMPSGSVGIGTKDPKGKLHVEGSIIAGSSEIYFTDTDHNHFGFGNTVGYAAIENGKNYGALMILGRTQAADNLRIVKLWDFLQIDVGFTQNVTNYSYLNQAGTGRVAGNGGNVSVSLKTGGRILCPEIDAYSDQRIKKDIIHSDPEADLKTLNQIRITDFRYKDEPAYGANFKKGVIAQELEAVFPNAVSTHPDFIPDIFAQSEFAVVAEGEITVTMKEDHGLATDDVVRLITPTGAKEVSIIKITDKVFKVNDWEEDVSEVFVYGKKAADFRTVDYNSIFSLGLSAIQELYKQMQSLKEELFGIKNLVSARLAPVN